MGIKSPRLSQQNVEVAIENVERNTDIIKERERELDIERAIAIILVKLGAYSFNSFVRGCHAYMDLEPTN